MTVIKSIVTRGFGFNEPNIVDISPASGLVGITTTISGTDFSDSGNTVLLNGTSATITNETSSYIEIEIPSLLAGIHDVTVTTSGSLSAISPNGFTVTDSGSAPTFGGITGMFSIGSGMFLLTWDEAIGTVTSYNIYIGTTSAVFSTGTKVQMAPTGATQAIIKISNKDGTELVDGVMYYSGIRAENNTVEDSNTEELNIQAGGASTAVQVIGSQVSI